jgi:hypothetical protein
MAEENKEDFLEVDSKIPGQNYVCLSFVSPEKVLKHKEVYNVSKFLEYIFTDEDLFATGVRDKMLNKTQKYDYDSIKTLYEDWKYSRNEKLEADFYELNDFKTSMRGLKVRGTYDSYKEATVRANILRKKDPSFNVFVGQVGYWLPWDPECESVPEQEYQEGMLNDLVKKYKDNLNSRDDLYEQVKSEKIEKAKKEVNEKKEVLKAQNEMKVNMDNGEDVKNIEILREIVDESDRLFYENMKKTGGDMTAASALSTAVPEEQAVVADVGTGEGTASDAASGTGDVSTGAESVKLDEFDDLPALISEEEAAQPTFSSTLADNLSEADPWIKRKQE